MKDADCIVQLPNGPLYYYGTAGYQEWRERAYRGDGFDAYFDEAQVDVMETTTEVSFLIDAIVWWQFRNADLRKGGVMLMAHGQWTEWGRRCMQFAVQHRPVLDWLP